MKNHVWREYQRGVRAFDNFGLDKNNPAPAPHWIESAKWVCRWCRSVNPYGAPICDHCAMVKPELVCLENANDEGR